MQYCHYRCIYSVLQIYEVEMRRYCGNVRLWASRDCRLSSPTVATAVGHPRRAVDAGQWLAGAVGGNGGGSIMGMTCRLSGKFLPCCGSASLPPTTCGSWASGSVSAGCFAWRKKITANAVMRYSGVYICKCAVCNNVKQYQYEKVVCYVRFRLCNFIIFILCLKIFLYNLLFADNFVNINMFKGRIFSGTA